VAATAPAIRQYGLGYVNLRPFADGLVIAGFKSCSGARLRCNGGAKEVPSGAGG
jgi:hypothetical protein